MTEKQTRKVLIFPARLPGNAAGGDCHFLFSMGQVADVLQSATVCPVPFSPRHIKGIAPWRNAAAPVFSPEGCLTGGGEQEEMGERTQNDGDARFVVVRGPAGTPGGAGEPAIFRTAGPVEQLPVPENTAPVSIPGWIVRPDRVRGVYRWEGRSLIVLDVGKLLRDTGKD